ncbi:MAG: DNA polymerase III subunit [Erysipelotrichaceae bacterium]|nr:DNA polymerase III subunit [Erysipelotrichaceae bacterium]
MLKDLLKKQQPVVYQALENACRNNRISNAYLFSGPYGTIKHEAAILLAESIFCEKKEGLACEECNTCRRVREGTYGDLIILDGSKKPVSKDDVDSIQERFSRTALENSEGRRVYIIENAETASASAQNSMLKFLEEPGRGVTAILTTDNAARLLPTIISRCTILPFVPQPSEVYEETAKEAGIGAEDAYLISHLVRKSDEIVDFYESEEYKRALGMFRQYLNLDGMPRDELLVDYDTSWRFSSGDSAKKSNITLLNAFSDLLLLYGHDVIQHDAKGPKWYHDAVMNTKMNEHDAAELIMIVSEQKDKINRFNDLNLLMAETFRRLEDLNHERNI